MAYFNHAFKKAFLATSVAADGTASSALTAGEVGIAVQKTTGLEVDSTATTQLMTVF